MYHIMSILSKCKHNLVFSHNGKILASGSMDGTILLWNWEEIMSQVIKDE